jgi:ParB/RepB/Spo0J family partition protein
MNTVKIHQLHSVNNIREVVKNNEYKQLKDNIEKVGLAQPITVNEGENGNYTIVDGHQRFEILKDLSYEDFPIHVIPSQNGSTSTLQLSANTFRVNMTLCEEVKVIKDLAESGQFKTQQDIADNFGKSNQWVTHRMQFANLCETLLIPEILSNSEYDARDREYLKDIARYDISLQEDAIEEYKGKYDLNDQDLYEEILHGNFRLYVIARYLDRDTIDLDVFNKDDSLFTKDELEMYAKQYGMEPKSLTLFGAEFDLNNKNVIEYAINDKYCEIIDELGALQVHNWNRDSKDVTFSKLVSYKNPIKQIQKMESWNGDIFNMEIVYKSSQSKVENNDTATEEATDTDPYLNSYRKLAKVVSPFIWSEVSSIVDRGLQSFKWFAKYRTPLDNIDKWSNDLTGKAIDNTATFDEFGRELIELSFQDSLQNSNITVLDSYLKLHKCRTVRTLVKGLYEDKDNFNDLRIDILKCFTIGLLKEKFPKAEGNTKNELVGNINENYTNWKFADVFKDKNSNFWNERPFEHRWLEDEENADSVKDAA